MAGPRSLSNQPGRGTRMQLAAGLARACMGTHCGEGLWHLSVHGNVDQCQPSPGRTAPTAQAAGMHCGAKGAAALLAGWKNNPNERKHIATNRRRK